MARKGGFLPFPSRTREGLRDLCAKRISRSGVGLCDVQPPLTPSRLWEGEHVAAGRSLPISTGVILTKIRIHSALGQIGSAEWIPDQVRNDGDCKGSF